MKKLFSQMKHILIHLSFQKSDGLLELLFLKILEESLISSGDIDNYNKIMITANSHKKHYKAEKKFVMVNSLNIKILLKD